MKPIPTLLVPAALCGALLGFSAPAPVPDAAASAPTRYEVDAEHSSVLFATKHLGVSRFYGRFNRFRGELEYDADRPSDSAVLVVVEAASVDTNSEGRDRHLRSPDFLAANEFPEIVFEGNGLKRKDGGLAVAGMLTLHGVTKDVEADVELIGTGKHPRGGAGLIGFEARFTIDPTDFEIKYMTDQPGALGPGVELIVSLEAVERKD